MTGLMTREKIKRSQLPPGPRVPAALQLFATWTRPAPTLETLRQRYGKRITVQLPFQPPFVILSDPEEIKQVFTAPPEVLHPGEGARMLEPMIGSNSVILLDEDPHLEQRKLLLPAFHGEKMARLTGLMEDLAAREIESWPAGEPVTLHPRLQRLTLEIILRASSVLTKESSSTACATPSPACWHSAKARCRCFRLHRDSRGGSHR